MGYIRVILGLYWGYIWIMEKKMENTIMGDIKFRGLGFRALGLGFKGFIGFRL